MPVLQAMGGPEMVDWGVIAKCTDEIMALQLCVQLSRMHYDTVAFKLGIHKSHFTRIMQGHGHLPAKKRTQLMSICRNIAPIQFDCLRFGLKLKEEDLDAEEQEAQRLAHEASQRLDKVRRARELRIAA